MKTISKLFFVFFLLIASNGVMQAQEKTSNERLQETRKLLEKQNETPPEPPKKTRTHLYNVETEKDSITSQPVINSILEEKPVTTQDTIIKEVPKADTPQPETQKKSPIEQSIEKPIEKPIEKKGWSLEECIEYAINHNINIKQLQLQQEEAGIQRSTAKNSRLPNLNASVENEWSFTRTENVVSEYENRSQSGSTASAQSVIPLFTGFRIPSQIARTKLEFKAATQNLEKAKEDLSLNISSLFLQVLFTKELYNINIQQFELSKKQVERTNFLVQSGSIPKSQLYDIEAQVAKDEVAVVNAQNDLELALLDLAQSLELERDTDFDIYVPAFTGDIITEFMSSLQPPALIYENAVNIKPVIKGQEYKVASAQKALRVAAAGYYPQLDLSFGIGTRFYHVYRPKEQINPITHDPIVLNPPFSDQIRDYGSKLISLNMSIPVFNRFQVRNQVRSARVDILNQQLILENNKKTLYKEIQTAHKNATAAQEKYRASERAVKSALESFDYAQKRYELGKATVFEFNESRTRYIQSQSEQAQAKYEYILRTKILDFYNGIPIKL